MSDGDILVCPLKGWQIGASPALGLVQIQYATTQEQLRTGEVEVLQLTASSAQLRALAEALEQLADGVDQLGSIQ